MRAGSKMNDCFACPVRRILLATALIFPPCCRKPLTRLPLLPTAAAAAAFFMCCVQVTFHDTAKHRARVPTLTDFYDFFAAALGPRGVAYISAAAGPQQPSMLVRHVAVGANYEIDAVHMCGHAARASALFGMHSMAFPHKQHAAFSHTLTTWLLLQALVLMT